MTTVKRRFSYLTVETITFVLVLGILSMIWPAIIALFLGALLLLQWFSPEQEMGVLLWTDIESLPSRFASLWQSGLPSILS